MLSCNFQAQILIISIYQFIITHPIPLQFHHELQVVANIQLIKSANKLLANWSIIFQPQSL